MQVTAQQAHAAIDGAQAKAREIGIPVIAAILDSGAHLKAFSRMDGAVLASIDIALAKAKTAVLFQCNSEDIWEYCKPGAPAPSLELTNGGLAPYGGGVALKTAEGVTVGAIGVSGGSIAQDSEIARAGLAAFRALMR